MSHIVFHIISDGLEPNFFWLKDLLVSVLRPNLPKLFNDINSFHLSNLCPPFFPFSFISFLAYFYSLEAQINKQEFCLCTLSALGLPFLSLPNWLPTTPCLRTCPITMSSADASVGSVCWCDFPSHIWSRGRKLRTVQWLHIHQWHDTSSVWVWVYSDSNYGTRPSCFILLHETPVRVGSIHYC